MASAEEKRRCRTVPDRFPSANNQHMVLGRKGMTTPVRIQQSIRQLETKGLTHTQIARELGVSRTTVVKYATRDYSPVPPTGGTASRSLVAGEYARKADEWLEADRRMPRKQRHTARRVHERLVEECGFEGSYSSVQRWVKRWRQRHRGEAEGFSELEWAPGSAQVDFGQALAVVAGVERTVHFLVVSFPYSNMRYVAALPGETAECVCHGLNKVFSHAGMVPRVLVFDNATGVGHRRADGTVTQTRLFSLFCAHYGFETRFCNPYSGWEKGSTENAVGFLRRNLMVPTPSAEGWDRLTDAWLERCDEIARGVHYREDVPIRDLFETDLDHMLPLPPSMFDACDWRGVKADRTGTVTIDSNRYLAGPAGRAAFHGRRADRHVGAQVGAQPRHRDGPAVAARHHRTQAAFVGRESHTLRLPGGDARAARPDGAARTRPAGRRHPPRGRGEWLPCGRHGRRRDRRRGQKARQGRDRPDGQADRAGRRSRIEGQARHVQQVHEGGRR